MGWFPYPFVMYLAMMILVGIWQHMLLGDWPFQNIEQPKRGIIMTIANLVIVWFVIDVIFYRILGLGFNFLNYYGLEAIEKPAIMAQVGVVCFVLIGFYTYPVSTIFFGKWPVQPSNIPQPAAGFAEIAWGSFWTLICYSVLIVPFFGSVFTGPALNSSWWATLGGTSHVHWVFGWWEWAIVILFMTPNVWRMKPWSLITVPQPWKGIISVIISMVGAAALAILCKKIIPMWVPAETFQLLEEAKGASEVQRFSGCTQLKLQVFSDSVFDLATIILMILLWGSIEMAGPRFSSAPLVSVLWLLGVTGSFITEILDTGLLEITT